MQVSVSWPTALTIGTRLAKMARARPLVAERCEVFGSAASSTNDDDVAAVDFLERLDAGDQFVGGIRTLHGAWGEDQFDEREAAGDDGLDVVPDGALAGGDDADDGRHLR